MQWRRWQRNNGNQSRSVKKKLTVRGQETAATMWKKKGKLEGANLIGWNVYSDS